jgi:plastocyanin
VLIPALAGLMAGGLLLAACGRTPDEPAPAEQTEIPPAVAEYAVVGRAPRTTSGTPAIVVLEPNQPGILAPPSLVPVMDQSARTFLPPILFARAGHPAQFRNSDEEMHNINVKHGVTRDQQFNVSISTGDSYQFTFEEPGLYDVACDVHAGMSAQIVVTRGPHVTLADPEGSFRFSDVPPGRYTVVVYAGPAAIEQAIEVKEPETRVDLSTGAAPES